MVGWSANSTTLMLHALAQPIRSTGRRRRHRHTRRVAPMPVPARLPPPPRPAPPRPAPGPPPPPPRRPALPPPTDARAGADRRGREPGARDSRAAHLVRRPADPAAALDGGRLGRRLRPRPARLGRRPAGGGRWAVERRRERRRRAALQPRRRPHGARRPRWNWRGGWQRVEEQGGEREALRDHGGRGGGHGGGRRGVEPDVAGDARKVGGARAEDERARGASTEQAEGGVRRYYNCSSGGMGEFFGGRGFRKVERSRRVREGSNMLAPLLNRTHPTLHSPRPPVATHRYS